MPTPEAEAGVDVAGLLTVLVPTAAVPPVREVPPAGLGLGVEVVIPAALAPTAGLLTGAAVLPSSAVAGFGRGTVALSPVALPPVVVPVPAGLLADPAVVLVAPGSP
ncbi:MAG: hypothetical protein JOY95_09830, partial [Silvibacterium sp.]|nr:hypothetical protein [Silvibacterium sp.]